MLFTPVKQLRLVAGLNNFAIDSACRDDAQASSLPAAAAWDFGLASFQLCAAASIKYVAWAMDAAASNKKEASLVVQCFGFFRYHGRTGDINKREATVSISVELEMISGTESIAPLTRLNRFCHLLLREIVRSLGEKI